MFQLSRIRVAVLAVLALVAFAALPVATTAAAPERFVIEVDETFTDEFLTDVCGFEVTQTVTGTIKGKTFFDEEGNPVREIAQFNLNGTFAANGNVVPFITRGPDRVTFNPDGSMTIQISGIIGRVVVPGQGVLGPVIGNFLVTISPEGDFTFEVIGGRDDGEAFFGSPGEPGLLCDLLAP